MAGSDGSAVSYYWRMFDVALSCSISNLVYFLTVILWWKNFVLELYWYFSPSIADLFILLLCRFLYVIIFTCSDSCSVVN